MATIKRNVEELGQKDIKNIETRGEKDPLWGGVIKMYHEVRVM